jgi:apolipoprotein N-acyltransferase
MMNDKTSISKTIIKDSFLCILSLVLLVLSFPPFSYSFLAWIAFIPFLVALKGKSYRYSFFLGWLLGFLFFLGTMCWLFTLMQWFGWIALIGVILLFIYLGLYFGLFGWMFCSLAGEGIFLKSIFTASAWVTLELFRAKLFTGFDWGCLGHTQYRDLPVIQIADITGVFGISFLIMMVNIYLKEVFFSTLKIKDTQIKNSLARLGLLTLVILSSTVAYGYYKINQPMSNQGTMNVAIIQGNIAQNEKWSQLMWPSILTKHMDLTRQALKTKPDLIIWPETSFPEIIGEDETMWDNLLQFVRDIKTPLLVGVIEKEGKDYFNSAFLISPDGEVIERYRKIHLVPFGEFFPMRFLLGPIADMLELGDFTSGKKFTLFSDLKSANHFSVLICFEDTVNQLARMSARAGSNLFINITNDAWFGDTNASLLHLQNAIFRTVENRRELIRTANTGISCFIDAKGRITKGVEDQARKATFVEGFSTETVSFYNQKTIYTKVGDVFAYLCFACILSAALRKTPVKLEN